MVDICPNTSDSQYQIFVSHGSADRWVATQIRRTLEEAGVKVFLDAFDIQVGDNFRQIILAEIRNSDELLVLLTPTSIERAWVAAEVGVAVDQGKRIVGMRYGVDLSELHERGLVSLIGDSYIIPLDDIEIYTDAVAARAEGR